MLWEERIRQAMVDMASKYGPSQIINATVVDLDAENSVCTAVTVDGVELPEVQLRANIDPAGKKAWVLFPARGSEILIGNVDNGTQWCVLMVSEISSIRSEINNAVFEIDGEKFQLSNEGENLGQLIDELFTAICNMVFTTNVGPTISLVNQPDFINLQSRFKELLK